MRRVNLSPGFAQHAETIFVARALKISPCISIVKNMDWRYVSILAIPDGLDTFCHCPTVFAVVLFA